jgi:hypothetical protein
MVGAAWRHLVEEDISQLQMVVEERAVAVGRRRSCACPYCDRCERATVIMLAQCIDVRLHSRCGLVMQGGERYFLDRVR